MSIISHDWPMVDGVVWVIHAVEYGGSSIPLHLIPLRCIVRSVGSHTVHLHGACDRKLSDVYPSQEVCQAHIPTA